MVIPLKYKKGITISNAFQNTLNESKCKPNKVWADQGSEFYNGSMKNKMTSVSKNVYIHKIGDIVNKYSNTYHSTIKMKPVDVKKIMKNIIWWYCQNTKI